MVVKDNDGGVTRAASALAQELKARGVRMTLDDNVEQSFGWRATEWDLQGVPIRVELGPRDLAKNTAVLYRRDTRDKTRVSIDSVVDEVQKLTGRIQTDMLEAATVRRDAFIADCSTLDQARDVAQTGVARVPWEALGPSGEEELAASGLGALPAARRRGAARHRRRRGCVRLRRPGLLIPKSEAVTPACKCNCA